MYFLINIIAILLGSILELIWLRRGKIKTCRALSLVALLAACVFFFGLDIRFARWPEVEVGFSAIRGIIGAGFALYIVQRFFEKHFRRFLEAAIIALPLMYSISKFSCLLVGCCHGFEYSGALAYVHEGKSYFPVQLIEIVCFFIITMAFIYVAKRKKNYLIYMPYVALGAKFLLDFLRERQAPFVYISVNQILLLALVLLWGIFLHKKEAIATSF